MAARRNDLTAAIGKIRTALACDARDAQPGCDVTFRYIVQVNRNNPPDEVFVQTAIAAALIRTEPRMVALNFVGPEDTLVARRDYTRHMQIIRFLASDVPVALHAGELWLGLVPPPDEAIEIAGARRIGHGVAVAFERDMEGLLAEMRARAVAVEVCLTRPTSSSASAARTIRCRLISRPACRSCCHRTMPAYPASTSPTNTCARRATMASTIGC